MLTLPKPPRRAYLRAFWILLSTVATGMLFALGSFFPILRLEGFGLVIPFLFLLVGIMWPGVASLPYRVWNRLVPLISRGLQAYLLSILYFVVFSAVGKAGSNLVLRRADPRNGWLPYSEAINTCAETSHPSAGWIRNYLKWATQSPNGWLYVLLPFLLLVSALELEEEKAPPTNIYTLY